MKVKVIDENNIIINLFSLITNIAKYYDIDHNTLSKYIKPPRNKLLPNTY